jgi:malate dehydrogenase (oxaloacetate-decarboxylating)(NADP+)
LADLAKLPVPVEVANAYNVDKFVFGKDYIIPKPLDPRLISSVASAVAKAAMDTGVAKLPVKDWDEYRKSLDKRLTEHVKRIAAISCV